ncbi:hypothetical protein [Mycolicibacterium hippocampi]|uniref:Large secreted protein n=1 Tax=Mycolicibacterium hippocampi TaxID=659824 RepID=A0A7I9ZGI9_9MYCO|nr:hypothetical protein [Mycolicibacterium hippocampi]GFH00131.1 hypothetical protein MHIP_06140 [Mycolicibacterium hippocampi]
MRMLAAVVVACAVLAGTVGGFAPPAAAQPPPGPPPVPVPETSPDTPALMFVDEPAILDVRPMSPQAWSRTADEHAVRLHFTSGIPECYGVTADVRETDDDVVVDLRTGTMPQAAGRACIAIAVSGGLDVPLQQPLGDRRVLSAT